MEVMKQELTDLRNDGGKIYYQKRKVYCKTGQI